MINFDRREEQRENVIDKDGGFTQYTTVVTVDDVAPTATLSNDGPVDEGSPATVSFSNQLDPSNADTSVSGAASATR